MLGAVLRAQFVFIYVPYSILTLTLFFYCLPPNMSLVGHDTYIETLVDLMN